jgi:Rps23 Pro-64 3,4-dihydroxylase Tpa1-like proline 4-hydroxylase
MPITADGIVTATLPMQTDDGVFLDTAAARAFGKQLTATYNGAEPYPHIVMDQFLPTELAQQILAHFPARRPGKDAEEYASNYVGIQEHKRQVFPNDCDAFCRNLFGFFNSAAFLQFLEGLTGIEGLIADPYFHGGGFHETSRGGKLGIHADFRLNEQLHLARRLNVLIYLNPDWRDDYAGHLEIWDRAMKTKCRRVAPLFNRCVVFNTDADSYHGHPEPLSCPEGVTRRSIALYYYTASRAVYEEIPANTTMYRARPGDDASIQRRAQWLRLQNYAKDFLPPILFRALRQLKKLL